MKRFHGFILGTALVGAGLGHASSGTSFISSTVDTVVKVMNTSTSGDGTAISAYTGLGNTAAIKATAASSGNSQWLTGLRGRAENIGGNYVFSVGTYGGSRGALNYDVSHGVYAEANNAELENWAVKGVANAEGGNRAVGAYVEGMNGTDYNRGLDAVATGGNDAYGVNAVATGATDENFGVKAVANANGGDWAMGVYTEAYGAANINYGVKAFADGGVEAIGIFAEANNASSVNVAGGFNGDVNVSGYCACSPSDEKLKKNVRPLEKGLATVLALKPKAYDMKVDEFKGRLNLATGPQVGMIAQDVEKLVPEAVRSVRMPARTVRGKDGKMEKVEGIEYKNLNYEALVPVLVKAIQEQQAKIEALEARVK